MNGIGAFGFEAESSFAYAALAIGRYGARIVRGAFRAIWTAAIEARFFAIDEAIWASWHGAHTGHACTARALGSERAGFSVSARKTRTTAIDVSFARIFGIIGAFVANALIHLANECTCAALYAVNAGNACGIAVTNTLSTIKLRADRPLHHGIMGQDAIGTRVGRAFFGIVVRVVFVNIDNVEHGIALLLEAIAIKLRRQWCTGGL